MSVEIGRVLGVGKTMVLKLLRRAADKRGVKLIDGRSRRIELSRKQQLPKKSERIFGIRNGLSNPYRYNKSDADPGPHNTSTPLSERRVTDSSHVGCSFENGICQ